MLRQVALLALALVPLSFAKPGDGQIADDFEKGWDKDFWPMYAPQCNGTGVVSLDTTVGYSGKSSMKVVGASSFCGHMFFGTTRLPKEGDLYVRVMIKPLKELPDDHITLIAMPDLSSGKHYRVGDMRKVLAFNREIDDNNLPEMSPDGVKTSKALKAGEWNCLEYQFAADGSMGAWLEDTPITGMTWKKGDDKNPNSSGWSRGKTIPKIQGVYFGWESYGDAVNTLWYDDIVIGSKKAGCVKPQNLGGIIRAS